VASIDAAIIRFRWLPCWPTSSVPRPRGWRGPLGDGYV